MTRKAVVSIGFREYAMSMTDAATLMKISERATRVDPVDGTFDKFTVVKDAKPFAIHMQIAEVSQKPKPKVIPKSHRLTHEKPNKDIFD
ncbi:hypothetical protein HK16_10725 [Acetobacter senegalensis]|uniref:Uncharacterized protein n=2 Tax=Acetobacter TaxID=434 RepID=A0A252EIQ2_9PROT|nr:MULTISPECIES: hypothetical protein [Acetobacter]ATJ89408.1 hypothetical protein CIW82_00420 [Acetobacter tropicalis]OUL66345.1 hypothetical protein HK16_10725 [Acetobacter senegalensis]